MTCPRSNLPFSLKGQKRWAVGRPTSNLYPDIHIDLQRECEISSNLENSCRLMNKAYSRSRAVSPDRPWPQSPVPTYVRLLSLVLTAKRLNQQNQPKPIMLLKSSSFPPGGTNRKFVMSHHP